MARPQKRAAQASEPHEALEIPAIPAEAWILALSPVRLADGAFEAVDSPARGLQTELAASFAEAKDRRWSARRSLAIITAGSLLSWAVLIITARAFFF